MVRDGDGLLAEVGQDERALLLRQRPDDDRLEGVVGEARAERAGEAQGFA